MSLYEQILNSSNSRPEMRKRNTFAFWIIILVLFILTVGNLLLTITIFSVLGLSKGMYHMELVPEEDTIKFYGTTDLDRIYKRDGRIEGFVDEPVKIIGDGGSVLFNLLHRGDHVHNKMTIDEKSINFKGINVFEVKDLTSGEVIFTTHRPHYNIRKPIQKLNAKIVSTSRITSPIQQSLKIEANKTGIRGSEGISLDGEEILFVAGDKITLNNTIGSTTFYGHDGTYLDMDKIPVVNSEYGIRSANIQYKICVCMPQGKLFRLPISRGYNNNNNNNKITCAHFNPKQDPCI